MRADGGDHDLTVALETQSLKKSFGGAMVINNLSISVAQGEALGIVGPNGAGKTTWFNLITGAVRADAGHVIFGGRDITHLARHERSRIGIGRTFQIPRPFTGMTVFENVMVGATRGRDMSERASYAHCYDILEWSGLLKKANVLAGSLNLLDRKRLELARAWATNPTVLLLDEIAGGLTEVEVEELIAEIKNLRKTGVTILWIEHIVRALQAVVDRIVVINYGRELCEGDPHEVMSRPEVQACYMGGTPL